MRFSMALLLLSLVADLLALIVHLSGLDEYWIQFMVPGWILLLWGIFEGRRE